MRSQPPASPMQVDAERDQATGSARAASPLHSRSRRALQPPARACHHALRSTGSLHVTSPTGSDRCGLSSAEAVAQSSEPHPAHPYPVRSARSLTQGALPRATATPHQQAESGRFPPLPPKGVAECRAAQSIGPARQRRLLRTTHEPVARTQFGRATPQDTCGRSHCPPFELQVPSIVTGRPESQPASYDITSIVQVTNAGHHIRRKVNRRTRQQQEQDRDSKLGPPHRRSTQERIW